PGQKRHAPPSRSRSRPGAPQPSVPRVRGPRVKTCFFWSSSRLPLTDRSLRKSRDGSGTKLQQQVSTALCLLHVLLLGEAFGDHLVEGAGEGGRARPAVVAPPLARVHEMG